MAAVITILCGMLYVVVQQAYRHGADDPQIQIAEDAARRLNDGALPIDVLEGGTVDISRSLAPFMIILDKSNEVVASTARLNGGSPTPPVGVATYTRTHTENRITWQPQSGVRLATVSVAAPTTGHVVMVGRNVREIESRIDDVTQLVTFGWLVSLALSASIVYVGHLVSRRFVGEA